MEFFKKNNFAHLLSLINIEMNPLRRKSLPQPGRRVESSQSFTRGFVPNLPGQGTRPLPASPTGISLCLCIRRQKALHSILGG